MNALKTTLKVPTFFYLHLDEMEQITNRTWPDIENTVTQTLFSTRTRLLSCREQSPLRRIWTKWDHPSLQRPKRRNLAANAAARSPLLQTLLFIHWRRFSFGKIGFFLNANFWWIHYCCFLKTNFLQADSRFLPLLTQPLPFAFCLFSEPHSAPNKYVKKRKTKSQRFWLEYNMYENFQLWRKTFETNRAQLWIEIEIRRKTQRWTRRLQWPRPDLSHYWPSVDFGLLFPNFCQQIPTPALPYFPYYSSHQCHLVKLLPPKS